MSAGDKIERSESSNISVEPVSHGPRYFPLSYSQQRLWFLDQLEPHHSVYNICKAERIKGRLNIEALESSLATIVRRHAILRTSFPSVDGKPVQSIDADVQISLSRVDLSGFSKAQKQNELEQFIGREASAEFDLARGPLWRASLLILATEEFIWLFTVHQMVWDGWSFKVFYRELSVLYDAALSNRIAVLPELSLQYVDYAARQREEHRGDRLLSDLSFWRQRLVQAPQYLLLPTDHPRPSRQTYLGMRRSVVLPDSLTKGIAELSRRQGTTLFMTLLAAFTTLLYRYSGQAETVVGCPVANRYLPEIDNLIGSFVNTLALNITIAPNSSFMELLSRVRSICLAAFAHQELPFERLVEELQPERRLNHNPIFQTFFAFQNTASPGLSLPGLHTEPMEVNTGTSKFDLTLSLAERDGRLTGFFEYSTDLFESARIERMAGHFETLLRSILADPNQPISAVSILTDAERKQILVEWNQAAAGYPKDLCIHELFEAQVERTPDAIAIEFESQKLTYQELNRRANQLAHHLRGLGVGPQKLVGICVERSLEMVVGLLGILKAGAAYVPLDPAYPRERLEFMLNDAQVAALLTQAKLVEEKGWRMEDGDPRSLRVPSGQASILDPRLQVVFVDRNLPMIEHQSRENPTTEMDSHHLAYVIYTSGSTAQPKGVQVSHRSVVNCLVSIGKRVALTRKDRLLAVTTISFDIAALEIFLPLQAGATVLLASREEATEGTELARRMKESSATVMQGTPSTWRMLIDAGWKGSSEFKILCGGELLSRELAEALLTHGQVWNLYGPTETTIWSTIQRVEPGEGPVSIGRPIANTQIHILDDHLQPVPIGVDGEAFIGGDGVARGYLNRPELTAEKFIGNPFGDDPESRLYRTGDRARFRADGAIEFIGRADNQVKIRGYRIELGEIENVLNQHPVVKESVIVVRERDSSSERELVGYLVPSETSLPSSTDLRNFLLQKLPDYMVPSIFVSLEDLPLTPNGKVDRNALPAPGGTRPKIDEGYVAPRTEIEELAAQVWREVLKLENVGIYDNFFDLGGHSLLGTRVIARLRSSFNVDIALRTLFELPTVAGLAEHIDFLRRSGSTVTLTPIAPVERNQALPLSFSQRRLWYLQKIAPTLSAYNIPGAFRIKGNLDSAALEQAFNEIINRHDVLRSCIQERDGQPFQVIVSNIRVAVPLVDLAQLPREQAEAEATRLAVEDAGQSYDLESAPLLRAKLVKLADDDHVFIFNFHHIIADGSSLVVFYREIADLYKAFRDGRVSPLLPLAIQYADYAVWQREWLRSSAFDTQLNYWKHQLAGLPPPLNFPTDFERPAAQTYHAARSTRSLTGDATLALKSLSRQQGVTLFMTLFATFNILLSRISGQNDIVIGSTIAGRNRPEIDGLIGFFINAVPLRTDLSGNPSFLILLQRVREVCLDAYTNQEVPFDKIVEEVRPQRERGHNPIFDILFNSADTSERMLVLPGCEVTKLSLGEPGAKFDIVLQAPEIDGQIELAIVYNADLFGESRIMTLLGQFDALLSQIVSNPGQTIEQLSLVTPTAQAVLPDPTEILDRRWEGAIHELLAEQAGRSPAKLAIVEPEQTWTYRELDRGANQLANRLVSSSIRRKDIVAIYAQRSSSLVLTILGALKAGAAFLILDPAYPVPRLTDYLRIAQPKGWIQLGGDTELPQELMSYLDSLGLRCRIDIPRQKQEIFERLSEFTDKEPKVNVTANDPAYVAFTSGSTGQPKGVLSRHGPITHFLPWQKEEFGLNEADRFAMLSGLAYSHLHRDIFTAVFLGATLYIPNPLEARSPDRLAYWLEHNAITILHLTPALGQLLLTSGAKSLPSVRRVFFGGDLLTYGEVAQIRELIPNAPIGSFYGATETQRAVGYYEIPNDLSYDRAESAKAVPLGHGIKDVQLLVLDKNSRLAGIGELGEIFVRSPHLAEGYVGDSDLSAQKFIVNPFTNELPDRLYKTGELARYLPDGNVEWAGRNDRRVNIRGFRVELEEVESVLKQHPVVKAAAVVLQDHEVSSPENLKTETRNPKLSQCLVAYVVAEEEQQSLVDLLRSYVSSRLPDYMVPAHFVILERLPLSPNGKVDFRALPSVSQFYSSSSGSPAIPRNDVEKKLCAVFAQVFGREQVGIDEDFFRLGGHSLLAAQVASRVREVFGVAVELRAFLDSPTVMALAKQVESIVSVGQTTAESVKDEREEFEI